MTGDPRARRPFPLLAVVACTTLGAVTIWSTLRTSRELAATRAELRGEAQRLRAEIADAQATVALRTVASAAAIIPQPSPAQAGPVEPDTPLMPAAAQAAIPAASGAAAHVATDSEIEAARQATGLLQQSLGARRWTDASRDELRQLLWRMQPEDQQQIVDRVLSALNTGTLKPDLNGPPI